MKKFLSLLMVLCMLLSMTVIAAFASDEPEVAVEEAVIDDVDTAVLNDVNLDGDGDDSSEKVINIYFIYNLDDPARDVSYTGLHPGDTIRMAPLYFLNKTREYRCIGFYDGPGEDANPISVPIGEPLPDDMPENTYLYAHWVEFITLNVPDHLAWDGYTATWSTVKHADYYVVWATKLNDGVKNTEIGRYTYVVAEHEDSVEPSYDFSADIAAAGPGEYVFYVTAHNDTLPVTHTDPIRSESITVNTGEPEPADVTVKLNGTQTATVTGDFTGLYVRVALVLDTGGQSALLVTQTPINPDGTIVIPAFTVPGLTVTGVSVALVESIDEITSPMPDVIASDFAMM